MTSINTCQVSSLGDPLIDLVLELLDSRQVLVESIDRLLTKISLLPFTKSWLNNTANFLRASPLK